jgi:hypothetical protein
LKVFNQQDGAGFAGKHVTASKLLHGKRPRLIPIYDPGGIGKALCPENDDATAERYATILDEAGIAVSEILGWNAYPWYINRATSGGTGGWRRAASAVV